MKITVFGEILWDIFPDKREIGGAAFNFAAHMAKLGADVTMLSALGKDNEGDDAFAAAAQFGIDLAHTARVDLPTGRSLITLTDGTPDYELPYPVAYDCVPLPPAGSECFTADALYFGTLPARSPDSVTRASLKALFEQGNFREIFYDINIRKQFYSPELLDLALSHATIFKLSRDERRVLDIDADPDNHKAFCRAICRRYPNLKLVLLTLDKDGSKVYDARADKILRIRCSKAKVVSTVGAGDSFSACFLYNYLSGEPVDVCLRRATVLADYVVGHLGAIPEYTQELKSKIRKLEN